MGTDVDAHHAFLPGLSRSRQPESAPHTDKRGMGDDAVAHALPGWRALTLPRSHEDAKDFYTRVWSGTETPTLAPRRWV